MKKFGEIVTDEDPIIEPKNRTQNSRLEAASMVIGMIVSIITSIIVTLLCTP